MGPHHLSHGSPSINSWVPISQFMGPHQVILLDFLGVLNSWVFIRPLMDPSQSTRGSSAGYPAGLSRARRLGEELFRAQGAPPVRLPLSRSASQPVQNHDLTASPRKPKERAEDYYRLGSVACNPTPVEALG